MRSVTGRRAASTLYHLIATRTDQCPFLLPRKVKNKDDILKGIQTGSLFTNSHYSSLAGIYASGNCPIAERLHAEVINLFNDHHCTVELAEQTCDIICKHL